MMPVICVRFLSMSFNRPLIVFLSKCAARRSSLNHNFKSPPSLPRSPFIFASSFYLFCCPWCWLAHNLSLVFKYSEILRPHFRFVLMIFPSSGSTGTLRWSLYFLLFFGFVSPHCFGWFFSFFFFFFFLIAFLCFLFHLLGVASTRTLNLRLRLLLPLRLSPCLVEQDYRWAHRE